MVDKLHLRLFGRLFVEIAGQSLTGIKTQKEALLLAYLAIAQRPFKGTVHIRSLAYAKRADFKPKLAKS